MRGSGHGRQDQLCEVHGAGGGGGLDGLPQPPLPAAAPQLLDRGGGRGAAGGRGQPQDGRARQVGRLLRAAVRTQVPDKVGVASCEIQYQVIDCPIFMCFSHTSVVNLS